MDDKSLPHGRISAPPDPQGPNAVVADRRAFFRRAVAVGIPVVLATVRGRSVHAQGISGCGSLQPSGACGDTGGLFRPGGGEDISKPLKPGGGGGTPNPNKPSGGEDISKPKKPY